MNGVLVVLLVLSVCGASEPFAALDIISVLEVFDPARASLELVERDVEVLCNFERGRFDESIRDGACLGRPGSQMVEHLALNFGKLGRPTDVSDANLGNNKRTDALQSDRRCRDGHPCAGNVRVL